MDRNAPRYHTRIIFAEGPTYSSFYSGKTSKFRKRLKRSQPTLNYWLFGAWLIRFLTKSRASHILISDGEVVLDYQFSKTKFWSHIQFVNSYEGVLGWIDIYSDVPQMFERWEGRNRPESLWRCYLQICRYLVGFFTFGAISGTNCVSISRQICAEAGIRVPWHYFSPALLRRWLNDHGADFNAGKPPALD
jgi:hypothetical protein